MVENTEAKKDIPILLVDDQKDYRDTMELWFKTEGYTVETAGSGQDAIDIIKNGGKRVVFLDIKMPGMDGVETLRRIREFDKELPVIMVTAHGDEKAFKECKKLNATGFFPRAMISSMPSDL
jgi:two-component system response regulator (stage 0 sporulation protein F)